MGPYNLLAFRVALFSLQLTSLHARQEKQKATSIAPCWQLEAEIRPSNRNRSFCCNKRPSGGTPNRRPPQKHGVSSIEWEIVWMLGVQDSLEIKAEVV